MKVVTISGTCSEVGKTSLVCALLSRLPGWAAVKVTRGHTRSCGRDPRTCCVSPLLGDEARVFADAVDTAVPGKDTGRYWDAGAAAVRWVVGKSGQEADGVRRALAGLEGFPGVLVEGNRVVVSLAPTLAILVASPDQREIKGTARRVRDRLDAVFVPEPLTGPRPDPAALVGAPPGTFARPVWGPADLDRIAARLR